MRIQNMVGERQPPWCEFQIAPVALVVGTLLVEVVAIWSIYAFARSRPRGSLLLTAGSLLVLGISEWRLPASQFSMSAEQTQRSKALDGIEVVSTSTVSRSGRWGRCGIAGKTLRARAGGLTSPCHRGDFGAAPPRASTTCE